MPHKDAGTLGPASPDAGEVKTVPSM